MKFDDVITEMLQTISQNWQEVDKEAKVLLGKKIKDLQSKFPTKSIALRFGEIPEDEDSTGMNSYGRMYREGGISTAGLLTVSGIQLKREANPIGDALRTIKDRTPYIIIGDLVNKLGHNKEPLLKNIIYTEEVPPWLIIGWYEQAAGFKAGTAGRYLRFTK